MKARFTPGTRKRDYLGELGFLGVSGFLGKWYYPRASKTRMNHLLDDAIQFLQIMKPFTHLTHLGRLRRFRGLAQDALKYYDLDVARFDLTSASTNLIYRVASTNGALHALRVTNPIWRTPADLRAEAMWLNALAKDTDIPVPQIIPSSDGRIVVQAETAGIEKKWSAVLMTWLPGGLLGKRLTEANLFKMGVLFGKLHVHGKNWNPPEGFTSQRFEKFLSRGEPNILVQTLAQNARSSGPEAVIRDMIRRVDAAYASLDRADLRVIHCDLWHDNIKVHRGKLIPFDFEDTIWGYRLHDIAMSMLDLAEDLGVERYDQLLPVFKEGYQTVLPSPAEGDMILLQMGRVLWRLNWIARFNPKRLDESIKFYAGLFQRTLAAGKLTDPLLPH